MAQIINLTPHAIHLPDRTIEASGNTARCSEVTIQVGDFDGIPLVSRVYGDVHGLPEPQADTLYIVSMLVRQALPARKDLASPGDLIRNGEGSIVGARNLIVNGV